ncbi:endonuclease/exonuclease/phosphatase family protein [Mameliella alba]|nr:endonuclease/exonuclease/phosphatase family protein [Antarctobacter heliothermus]MBY6142471.1 endonuclease/exonuclease/phosphatase family protein [Mameliella alba]
MLVACAACAEPLRVATWHGDFSRKGPGLLLVELEKNAPDLTPILTIKPDVLLLTDFDYDAGLVALGKLRDLVRDDGAHYPHLFSARPNTGMPTGRDLDGDGRRGGPRDAQGFGWFSGQGGMAILSRHPVRLTADHTELPWRDTTDSLIDARDPGYDVQRLSSAAHWAIEVAAPEGVLTLLTLAATPPVFDGPEDRNGRRNRDEVLLWAHVLDGTMGEIPDSPVVLLGNLNLDPARGDGLHDAAERLLSHPRLQDPLPDSHSVTWDSTGPMRVSYALPDRAFGVADAGVTPPSPDLGPHGLVWVDLIFR